jgi:hypothetical protein
MRIGWYIPSGEQVMIKMVVMAMMIKCSGLEKKKEKNKKLKAKVYLVGAFCFGGQDT